MVICDGCYAHTVDEVLEICAAMGILMVILPPHCTHILQGEDLYHFGVFKGAFRVERAEIEAMKQLACRVVHQALRERRRYFFRTARVLVRG